MAALQTQGPKVSTKNCLKLKLSNKKQVLAGSPVLGGIFPDKGQS